MKKSILVLCTLIGLFSCNSSKKGTEKKTENTVATLQHSYMVTKINDKTDFKKNATIKFNDDFTQISGNSGCNSYGGAVTIKENTFSMDPFLKVTKMYCQETMADEKMFFRALKEVKTFKVSKDNLFFLNENGKVVIEAKNK